MRVMIIVSFALGIIIGAIGTEYYFVNYPPPAQTVVCSELGPEAIRQLGRMFIP